jgi:hypothetical protein
MGYREGREDSGKRAWMQIVGRELWQTQISAISQRGVHEDCARHGAAQTIARMRSRMDSAHSDMTSAKKWAWGPRPCGQDPKLLLETYCCTR